MARPRKQYVQDLKRKKVVGYFYDFDTGTHHPFKRDLCSFEEYEWIVSKDGKRKTQRTDQQKTNLLNHLWEAKRAEIESKQKLTPNQVDDSPTLGELIPKYLDERPMSDRWRVEVERYLGFWGQKFGHLPITSISPRMVSEVRDELVKSKGLTSANRAIASLSGLLTVQPPLFGPVSKLV